MRRMRTAVQGLGVDEAATVGPSAGLVRRLWTCDGPRSLPSRGEERKGRASGQFLGLLAFAMAALALWELVGGRTVTVVACLQPAAFDLDGSLDVGGLRVGPLKLRALGAWKLWTFGNS